VAANTPFPRNSAAADRALLAGGIDEALCRRLLALLERDPERVAEQVRAWLMEDEA
jgi:flagellar biosynthesis/type III secretory pathway M-ring protein FliF/YscJ